MTIEIIGRLDQELSEGVKSAFEGVIKKMGQVDDVYVELTLSTPEEIKEVNRDTRGVDKVTDVLSFPTIETEKKALLKSDYPYDVDPESGEIMLGEIMLCLERAKEQAEEFGHGLKREVAFLVTHGLLHLFGFDHMVDEDEREMFPLQEEILEEIGIKRQ